MAELGAGTGTGYPSAIDTDTSIEVNSPSASKTKARAEVVNDLAAAIVAIETELGTAPSGTLASVRLYLEVEHGVDGTHDITKVVKLTATQTLTNKTLTSPTITTPTITVPTITDFTNANHTHQSVAQGGTGIIADGAITNAKLNGGCLPTIAVPEATGLNVNAWTTFYTSRLFYIPAGVTKLKVRARNKRSSGTDYVQYRLVIGSDNGTAVNGVQSATWTTIDLEITPSAGNKGTFVQLIFQYNAVTGTVGAFHKATGTGDTANDYSDTHYFSDT